MAQNESDFDLVESYLSGDESSFNKIVARYQHKIYWHARRMTGNHFDADEVLQEVMIVMYKKLKDFQFKSSLYTWLYKITATRSINYLRKKKLREIFSLDDSEPAALNSKEEIVVNIEDKEKLKHLDEVLKLLPEKQRQIFIMRTFDELSYEEISQITGKSTGGLKANYFHAIRKITDHMKKYEE